MKVRVLFIIVGLLTVAGTVGFIAWKQPWVRSFIASDSADPTELDLLSKEKPQNVAPPDPASGSPQWRGASRLGVAPAGNFRTDWDKTPPKELWRVPIGGGFGSCSVVGGKVYVQDRQADKDRVVCLDAASGKTLWDFAYDAGQPGTGGGLSNGLANGPRSTPTVVGNWVYAVGGDGQLHALETEGDKVSLRWRHDLLPEFGAKIPEWGFACSPLVLGDLVIVQPGGKDAAVVAFDKTTGEVKWKTGSNPPSYSSPVAAVIDGEMTVLAFMGDALLAIRPTDGKLLSISRDKGRKVEPSYPWKTQYNGNIATPLVVGNYVYISAAYGAGCALLRGEKKDGEVRLIEVYANRREGFQNHHATSVYKDGYLFGIHGQQGGARLKCYTFEKGEEVEEWVSRIGQASILLAGDHLILQTETGELCLVEANPKEFKLVAKVPGLLSGQRNWASPILVEGRIYLRDEKNVVCLDVKP